MNITEILKSREHNTHYLSRYIKFIEYYQNQEVSDAEYYEEHHICPKGKGMFPEYASFKSYPENSIYLTVRQHIIAHILLWKAFPKSLSVNVALNCMLGYFNAKTNPYLQNRVIPKVIELRYYEKAKREAKEKRKDFATYLNLITEERHFIHNKDPIISELGLVGVRYGSVTPEEVREKQRRSKDYNRRCTVYKGSETLSIYARDLPEYIFGGWSDSHTDEIRKFRKEIGDSIKSKNLKGRYDYYNPDGTYAGKLTKDMADIMNVVKRVGTRQSDQFFKATIERNTGTKWYNNGTEEARLKEPKLGWTLGKLPRSKEHSAQLGIIGFKYYNDGYQIENLKLENNLMGGYRECLSRLNLGRNEFQIRNDKGADGPFSTLQTLRKVL